MFASIKKFFDETWNTMIVPTDRHIKAYFSHSYRNQNASYFELIYLFRLHKNLTAIYLTQLEQLQLHESDINALNTYIEATKNALKNDIAFYQLCLNASNVSPAQKDALTSTLMSMYVDIDTYFLINEEHLEQTMTSHVSDDNALNPDQDVANSPTPTHEDSSRWFTFFPEVDPEDEDFSLPAVAYSNE